MSTYFMYKKIKCKVFCSLNERVHMGKRAERDAMPTATANESPSNRHRQGETQHRRNERERTTQKRKPTPTA